MVVAVTVLSEARPCSFRSIYLKSADHACSEEPPPLRLLHLVEQDIEDLQIVVIRFLEVVHKRIALFFEVWGVLAELPFLEEVI